MGSYSTQIGSLIEFPGEVAAIVFYSDCAAKCPYCHNRGRIGGKSLSDVLKELTEKRKYVTGVVLTGGEMTQSPDVMVLASRAKEMGLKVKLHTNGSNPAVVGALRQYIDRVDVDIKTTPGRYYQTTGIGWESVVETLAAAKGVPVHFHTTICPDLIVASDMPEVLGALKGGFQTWKFQECQLHGHGPLSCADFEKAVALAQKIL